MKKKTITWQTDDYSVSNPDNKFKTTSFFTVLDVTTNALSELFVVTSVYW